MANKDLIRRYPTKRVSPYDGMAVTARVWADAHDYHRTSQQLQALFDHGPGILAGLQVLASDPPDSSVYVQPGIARDAAGQIIVLSEPVRYDLEQAEGYLQLLLSYGEGRPLPDADSEAGITYVHSAFAVEAKPVTPESAGVVELARIRRWDAAAPIADAPQPQRPGANEIDLRYRREIGAVPAEAASVAVVHVGAAQETPHAQGACNLARALRQAGRRVWVDEGVLLTTDLAPYTMVYMVGQGKFELGAEEMNTLYSYIQGGGTLFIESCRQDVDAAAASDAALADLLGSLGVQLEPLPADHPLLQTPSLFAAPPVGFETEGTPQLLANDRVIYSTFDYGCLWRGLRRQMPPSREEIRAAVEWGENLIAYALARRPAPGV